jgi:hypothetical protein
MEAGLGVCSKVHKIRGKFYETEPEEFTQQLKPRGLGDYCGTT